MLNLFFSFSLFSALNYSKYQKYMCKRKNLYKDEILTTSISKPYKIIRIIILIFLSYSLISKFKYGLNINYILEIIAFPIWLFIIFYMNDNPSFTESGILFPNVISNSSNMIFASWKDIKGGYWRKDSPETLCLYLTKKNGTYERKFSKEEKLEIQKLLSKYMPGKIKNV